MNKIEHLGIAVQQLETAITTYETMLQTNCYKRELVDAEGVETAFFKIGESKIELLASVAESSAVHAFLQKRGEGLHHVAFAVDDICAEMRRLQDEGFVLLSNEPKRGADNKLICFVHPKSANGVLIELCQDIG